MTAETTARPRKKPGAPRRVVTRGFDFLKEWGGLATVLIAVLYTFPFDLSERYFRWMTQGPETARKVIAEATDIYIDGTKTISGLDKSDPDFLATRDFVQNMYNAKLFNLLVPNVGLVEAAAPKLSTVEVYGFGSLLSNIGRTRDGVRFYQLALEREKDLSMIAAILREKANALSRFGPDQDYGQSQADYLRALEIASRMGSSPAAMITYLRVLSELVVVEYYADFQACANAHRLYFYQLRDAAMLNRAMQMPVGQMSQMFEMAIANQPPLQSMQSACDKAPAPFPSNQ